LSLLSQYQVVQVGRTSSPLVRLIAPLPEDIWVHALPSHCDLCAAPHVHHRTIGSVIVAVTACKNLLHYQTSTVDQERLEKKRNRRTKGVDTVQTQAGVSKRRSTWIQVDLDEKWGNMCTVSLGRVTIGVS
jgi:hypothetical protein